VRINTRRDTRAATPAARTGAVVARLYDRAGRADDAKAFHALFGRIGARANMQFPIHPHMLRHACGFKLANDGHDTRALQHYLGHKNIQHTVRYTELSLDRFRDFWRA
jgi:site-specific recombinase XerD